MRSLRKIFLLIFFIYDVIILSTFNKVISNPFSFFYTFYFFVTFYRTNTHGVVTIISLVN